MMCQAGSAANSFRKYSSAILEAGTPITKVASRRSGSPAKKTGHPAHSSASHPDHSGSRCASLAYRCAKWAFLPSGMATPLPLQMLVRRFLRYSNRCGMPISVQHCWSLPTPCRINRGRPWKESQSVQLYQWAQKTNFNLLSLNRLAEACASG